MKLLKMCRTIETLVKDKYIYGGLRIYIIYNQYRYGYFIIPYFRISTCQDKYVNARKRNRLNLCIDWKGLCVTRRSSEKWFL